MKTQTANPTPELRQLNTTTRANKTIRKALYTTLLLLLSLPCSSVDLDFSFHPQFSHYDLKPVAANTDSETIPWTNGIKIDLSTTKAINNSSRIALGIGYNTGDLVPESASEDYSIAWINVHCIESSISYSYDIHLNRQLILNPEIGLNCQLPLSDSFFSSHHSSTNSTTTSHSISTPVLGLVSSVWLTLPLNHRQNKLSIGLSGSLPFYRIEIGEYTITDQDLTYPIRTGLGYLGLGLSYTFKLKDYTLRAKR